ncbi:MAG TPA: Gfo/Idh/MocA family oxidoreductase [Alloacidobacterium sp.]|nr:Gfo/Idh/MocA family oxidoreductase [Alloacidobacterium sp.]
MKRLKTAVIGTGFMGRVHLEALRRVEFVDVVAVAGRRLETAKKLAEGYGIETAVNDYRELLQNAAIDAVHVCTPNAAHYQMAKDALLAGKHVLCEKPLAISADEAQELVTLARERNLRNCVCHNLRYYPMVQQMRSMRENGDLGQVLVVQGTYSQDWLLYETDWNWRVDSAVSGPMRAMADIGSHWFDTAEHVTGLRVQSLCADLQTYYPVRKRSKQNVETFAGKLSTADDNVEEIPVNTEDFGAVIFRMGENTRGAMTASQVSAGRKNSLSIEIYGTKSSVAWNQERPDELWIGHRDAPNQVIVKDPALLAKGARAYADLPGGHSEGYDDTFKQVFRRFYLSIAEPQSSPEYPQMLDGLRQINILRAELESHHSRSWVRI